jgi:pyruvate kinase
MRRAKIICTLGPSSSDPGVIRQLIESGMDVARLNFSHGSHESHRATFEAVRHVSKAVGRPVAVMQDLQGPRIRLGRIRDGGQELARGARFELVPSDVLGDRERASTTYAHLTEDVEPGQEILISDGRVKLRVESVSDAGVVTRVEVPGLIHDAAGLNLPQTGLRTAALTAKDLADTDLGIDLGVDYIALSFVRAVLDIHQLRSRLTRVAHPPAIIAKIERPRAVDNAHKIIEAADGVMIARGDLGVELAPERVPLIQKGIIHRANALGKTAITATQMLESMRSSPIPTRAEASDVANAVLDGSDAVMLSGETASGRYPVEAVQMMSRIICEVEGSEHYRSRVQQDLNPELPAFPSAVATAATAAADRLSVNAICAFTGSGRTARLLKTARPLQQLLAFTPDETAYHRMALYWGVRPVLLPSCHSTGELTERMESYLARELGTKPGDCVVMVMGVPIDSGAEPNTIKLHRIGEPGTSSWDTAIRFPDEDDALGADSDD